MKIQHTIPLLMILVGAVSMSGCAQVTEVTKTLWGSSTRALENARTEAISRTFDCRYDNCFDTVARLGRNIEEEEKTAEKDKKKTLQVFMQNKEKRHLVVMGVPNAIDTTEVGVFFAPQDDGTVKIDIASLSSIAKRNAAEIIFEELRQYYREVK